MFRTLKLRHNAIRPLAYEMPILRVITVPDPAQLLERAVEGLFPLSKATDEHPWPTLSAWVVLRQGGLRDDLHRLAATKKVAGWFDSPVCLFNEVATRWGSGDDQAPLSEPERHAIVAGLIEKHGGSVFGRAQGAEVWVPAVDRLIGELVGEGVEPAAFSLALNATANDKFSHDRATVLSQIYAGWHVALSRDKRCDGRDGKVRLAHHITENPERFAERLGGRRDIRIVGLADLRGGWRQLLGALAASKALDHVDILTTFELELPAELRPEYVVNENAATFANALFSLDKFTTPNVSLVEAPDATREVELIAVRVRKLIDAGIAPTRIAVIARQARPTVNEMSAALTQLGVPVSARRRTGMAHTAPARALRAILATAKEDWARHSIVELAENPLLSTGLDVAVVNQVGYTRAISERAAWREGFVKLVERCKARARGDDDGDEHRQSLPGIAQVEATLVAWDALARRLAEVEATRPAAAWFRWVAATLRNGEWGIASALEKPLSDAAVWQSDVNACDQIVEFAVAWMDALKTFGSDSTPIDAATFDQRLKLLLEQDLITPPATDFGVVVSEALAAGWRAFDHVFVVGLSAGEFPNRPTPGAILDRDDRRALIAAGLMMDAPDAWRDRERELFRVVCAGARVQLTLSWPVMDASGREVARSAYVDEAAAVLARHSGVVGTDDELVQSGLLERIATNEMLVSGYPVARDAAAIAHARIVAAVERDRTREPTVYNGSIEDPALSDWLKERYDERFVWSATQLEKVAKCRWEWFAEKLLKLDPRGEADDQMEPTVRGTIVHETLHKFFEAAVVEFGAPVYLRDEHLSKARTMLNQSLDSVWAVTRDEGNWLGAEALQGATLDEIRTELGAYLDFEIKWNEKSWTAGTSSSKEIRTGYVEGEGQFDGVKLSGGGATFLLRGSVDRIDRGVDERFSDAARYIAAIDYKSTIYSTPAGGKKAGWKDGVVLQVPLYTAALQALRPEDLIARMEYRSIRPPKAVHGLSLAPVKAKKIQDAAEAEGKLETALADAGRRVLEVRSGELPAQPTDSCGCSPFCPARDICRVPGGPVDVR